MVNKKKEEEGKKKEVDVYQSPVWHLVLSTTQRHLVYCHTDVKKIKNIQI